MKIKPLLTRREVARRLGRPTDYVSGALDALKIPYQLHGRAYVITEAQFRRIEHLSRSRAS